MADFQTAFRNTLDREGGLVWSNVKTDRGGETFAGISRRIWGPQTAAIWAIIDGCKGYSDFPKCLSREALTAKLLPLVEQFFKTEFWDKPGISRLTDQKIAQEVYDTSINCGASPAVRFLQEGCWALGLGQGVPPIVDGQLGPTTADFVNALCRKVEWRNALLVDLNIRQGSWYQSIIRRDPAQRANYRGWLNHRIREDFV